ncbi:Cytochrome c-type biogenesis protein CcmE [Vibrio stylophorae]|uniref:Cytochrome c-type biogenesis protein CcmE n=1 Tax=Vibrio stylophorae TaxID=659351 RepID=A0ABN8DUT0_9VIBR|nr:cytochrome c maturation protein CcmE [Vibrio stylophorae]CAH0534078.1 Cytochrome c-type biogenesis protein CcmE [Vibrio stylophorae]
MTPRRRQRLIWAVALLLLAGVATALMVYALRQNINFFFTPTEVIYGNKDGYIPEVGQRIRIGGMVEKGSVIRESDSLAMQFKVSTVGPAVTIYYSGILPDLFREGQGIVAEGELISPNELKASTILAKHDEEYMPPEVAEEMGKIHQPLEYTPQQKGLTP